MQLHQEDYLFWLFGNSAALFFPWMSVRTIDKVSNNTLRVAEHPVLSANEVAFVDLAGSDFNLGNTTFNLNDGDGNRLIIDRSGTFNFNFRGVDYFEAELDKDVIAIIHSKYGFATNGSAEWIKLDVGWHDLIYTYAHRDSFVQTGVGQDKICFQGDFKWAFVRRDEGQLDAYNLHSGNFVRMADWKSLVNWGGVDEICTSDRDGNTVTFFPPLQPEEEGDRLNFSVIDLSATGNADPADYTDSFNHASFRSINYATTNVHKGTAVIETFTGDKIDGVQATSKSHITTNGVHDLLLEEQSTAIAGHLRLYVRDNESGLYNRFNEVFLGSSEDSNVAKDYSTTSRNAYALNAATGEGAQLISGAALFGFSGNDTLTGGDGTDYIFGGSSTYSLKVSGHTGNKLTGGDGADYFGVGDITHGVADDLIMVTDFSDRLSTRASDGNLDLTTGSASDEAADLETRVATDRIMDWTAGVDFLRVLGNGTAIIEGLGTERGLGGNYNAWVIGSQAERIDVSGPNVVNDGKIVIRGMGGGDTIIGSTGADWIYTGNGKNVVDISAGGANRIYVDSLNPASLFVKGFDENDRLYLNEEVVDSFASALGRPDSDSLQSGAKVVNGSYTSAVDYDAGPNFLHSTFYNRLVSDPATNEEHIAAKGSWDSVNDSADSITFGIGVGMFVTGTAMIATGFLAAAGEVLRATGIALGGGSALGIITPTIAHQNATISGRYDHYINILNNNDQPATTIVGNNYEANESTTVQFLDFFADTTTTDGFTEVLEFTDQYHIDNGVFGYFAVTSNTETFVYLVASRDNLVENSEAIKIAELDGTDWTADNFMSYIGADDIYNQVTTTPPPIATPQIDVVKKGAIEVSHEAIIVLSGEPLTVEVSLSGEIAAGSVLKLFDGQTEVASTTLSAGQGSHTFTDSRGLGTTAFDTGDDIYILRNSEISYRVELENAGTGIITRSTKFDVTASGGNAVINGGGSGTLIIATQADADFVNSLSDPRLIGMETLTLADENGVSLDLSNQGENFEIIGSIGDDTITGGAGDDKINASSGENIINSGVGRDIVTVNTVSTNTVNLSGGGSENLTTVVVTAGTVGGTTIQTGALNNVANVQATAAGSSVGVLMTAGAATGSTTVNFTGGDGNDTIIGSSGNDTLVAGSGDDIIISGSGHDQIDLTAGGNNTLVFSVSGSGTGLRPLQGTDTVISFETTSAERDVIDASAFQIDSNTTKDTPTNLVTISSGSTNNTIVDGSVILIDLGVDIESKDFSDGNYLDLFGVSGPLSASLTNGAKALIVVQGLDETHVLFGYDHSVGGILSSNEVHFIARLQDVTNLDTLSADSFLI